MTTSLGERRLIGWCFTVGAVIALVLVIGGWLAGPEYIVFVGQAFRAVVEAVK